MFLVFLIYFYTPHLFQRGWFSGHSADVIYCIVSQHQHVFIINKRLEMFGEPGCQFTWCSMSQLTVHWNEIKLTFKKKFLNTSASATWNSDLCLAVIQFQTFASCKSSPKLQELSYRNFSTSLLLSSNLSWPFTKCYFKWRRFLRVQIKTSNSLFNHVSVLLINKPEVPLPWCNIQSQYFTMSFITLSKTKLESYEPTCFLHIINLILINEKT